MNELIIFYSEKDNPSLIEMAIFKEEKSTLQLQQKIQLPHAYLSNVEFIDLDQNGKKEILLSFSFAQKSAEQKSLFVYKADKQGVYEVVDNNAYYDMGIIPYNNAHILLFISKQGNDTLITLSTFEKNRLQDRSQLVLPLHLFEIRNIQYGNISKKDIGITIDSLSTNEEINTILIQVQDYALKEIKHSLLTESPYLGYSSDFNNDSIIEIPISQEPFIFGDSYFGIMYFYRWDGNNDFEHVWSSYFDQEEGYNIVFPDTYKTSLDVITTEKTVSFLNKDTEKELFKIFKVTKKDIKKKLIPTSEGNKANLSLYEEYDLLAEKNEIVYLVPKKAGFFEKGFQFFPYIIFND